MKLSDLDPDHVQAAAPNMALKASDLHPDQEISLVAAPSQAQGAPAASDPGTLAAIGKKIGAVTDAIGLSGGGDSIGSRIPVVGAAGKYLGQHFRAGVDSLVGGGSYDGALNAVQGQDAQSQADYAQAHPIGNGIRTGLGVAGSLALPIPGSGMTGLGGVATRVAGAAAGSAADAGLRGDDAAQAALAGGGVASALEALPGIAGRVAQVARPLIAGPTALASRAVVKVGETLAGVDAGDAAKAMNTLNSAQLMAPEPFMPAAGKAVGDARAALQAEKVTVPGSRDVAQGVLDTIAAAKARGISHPNADAVAQMVESRMFDNVQEIHTVTLPPWEADAHIAQATAQLNDVTAKLGQIDAQRSAAVKTVLEANGQPITPETIASVGPVLDQHPGLAQIENLRGQLLDQHQQLSSQLADMATKKASGMPMTTTAVTVSKVPKELSLDELDDIIVNLDHLGYTPAGSPRALAPTWGPAVRQSRAALNDVISTVPEGQLFQQSKDPYAALSDAHQYNARLGRTIAGTVLSGVMGTGAHLLGASGEAASTTAAITMAALQPTSYYRLLGALKVPGDVVEMLSAARGSGKVGMINQALQNLAQRSPVVAENLVRGAALVASKPSQNQFLTGDEVKSLGARRDFSADAIAAEKQRIKSDNSLSSSEKATQLSAINKSGYVTLEGPAPRAQQQEEPRSDEGEDAVEALQRSLKSYGE